jgi:hypothetical protein
LLVLLGPLIVFLLLLLAAGIIAGLLFVLGTILSRIFAVSVWEATVVVTAVAAVVSWLFWSRTPASTEELEEPEEQPTIVVPDLPWRAPQGSRRRKR